MAVLEVTVESSDFDCSRMRVHTLDGNEQISTLFEFRLEVFVEGEPIEADAIVGGAITIVFQQDRLAVRQIHGMVARVLDLLDPSGKGSTYRLTVVPLAYRLTTVQMLDVLCDLSVPDVIKAKLGGVGLEASFDLRLHGSYEARDFLVQYNESDYALVARLTEHLGISFFFEEAESEARIVFADDMSGFSSLPKHVPFRGRGDETDVFALEAHREVLPSLFVVQDYNYRTPLVDLSGTYELPSGYAGGLVDFGSHVKTPKEAERMAKIRSEERHAAGSFYRGRSDSLSFSAGHYVIIDGHARLEAQELLLVSVHHHVDQRTQGGGSAKYVNEFTCVPKQQGYRPLRQTPRPRIGGVVTGIVDGGINPGSAEIARIDDQGRYLVRLLFDTAVLGQRNASHPIRMAQPHAGPGYGQHFPLKPGVEVIVLFVNGDPDRPIIAGAVPNPLNPSPVVAADATINRIRTQSGIVIELHDR